MSVQPNEVAYLIHQFGDEILPCDCSLAGWADWLSKPDPEWNRAEGAKDGDQFPATPMRFDADIVAERRGGAEWTFSGDGQGAALLAVRYGEGAGWSSDAICDNLDGVREYLAELGDDADQTEYIAVGRNDPDMLITFRVNEAGQPYCTAEVVQ